jgi:hypothetical protein
MGKRKQVVVGILAIVLTALLFVTACAQAPAPAESMPPSPPEPEEHEERPINISSLAWELEAQILRGELETFLQRYPIKRPPLLNYARSHELLFGVMVTTIPADNVYKAKVNIENAVALLTKGKLPNEIESRPLDKNEVLVMLTEAKSLLEEQRFSTQAWEKDAIEWAAQPGPSTEIGSEATRVDIIETFDDYRQRLSTIIGKLDRIISDLPMAVEDE